MTDAKNALVERLFAAHRGALQAFFYRRVRQRADATDLAQEVYLRMLRVKDISAIRDSEAYLYSVASNLAKEHFGSDRRRGISVDVEDPTIQEQLAERPRFDGEILADQQVQRLRVSAPRTATEVPRGGRAAVCAGAEPPANRGTAANIAAHGKAIRGAGACPMSTSHGPLGMKR